MASSTRSIRLFDDRAGVEAGHFLAGFNRDSIGFLFDAAGTGCKQLAVGGAACLKGGDMVREIGGDVVSQSRLTHDDRKQGAIDAFQAPDQIGFDLISDQPNGSPRA